MPFKFFIFLIIQLVVELTVKLLQDLNLNILLCVCIYIYNCAYKNVSGALRNDNDSL